MRKGDLLTYSHIAADIATVPVDVDMAKAPQCTSTQRATILAWEGDGVYVLDLNDKDWAAYNKLPVTTDVRALLPTLNMFPLTSS